MVRHDSSSDDDSSAPRHKRPRLDSSGSEASRDQRRARKAEKKAKKQRKKDKKRAKKEKKRRADEPAVYLGGSDAPRSPLGGSDAQRAPPAAPAPPPAPPEPKKTGSRAAFFASLQQAERDKAPVGTFHATGKYKEDLEAENDRSGDWLCTKCQYTNFKECLTCARCRSLRRFEGRNQASGYCQ
jgi:hypothetical protein